MFKRAKELLVIMANHVSRLKRVSPSFVGIFKIMSIFYHLHDVFSIVNIGYKAKTPGAWTKIEKNSGCTEMHAGWTPSCNTGPKWNSGTTVITES
jgi:hypothetical protein